MIFEPCIEGPASIRSSATQFLTAFRRRVEVGLLCGHPHPRSHYVVTQAGADQLHVSAAGWWTAMNVGLNEIELQTSEPGCVRYTIRYWRWATYVLGLGAGLVAIMLAVSLGLDLRQYIEAHPASRVPGLSTDQNVLVAWGMAVFWGLVWPWLLIALHKRPLRRLIGRLIAEVDAGATTGGT